MPLTSLPTWDLTDFYQSTQDPTILQDLNAAKDKVSRFVETYAGKLTSGQTLLSAIKDYEVIEDLMAKLMSFAFLNSTTQLKETEPQQFLQHIQEQVTNLATPLVFFNLEVSKLDDAILTQGYADVPDLKRYQSWFDNVRLYKHHQLSEDQERLMLEKSLTGRSAWNRLYDETLAGIQFDWRGDKIGISEIVDKLSNKDAKTREEAAKSMSVGLKSQLSIFTMVTNVLAKDKEIDDRWRKYSHAVASRNLANQVEDEVVEALAAAVKRSYKDLTHRYYALKAKWLGLDKIEYWDRNAPLPSADDRTIAWDEAKKTVYEAYHRFSPELAEIGQRFF